MALLAAGCGDDEPKTRTVTLTPERDVTLFEDADGDTASGSGTGLFVGVNGLLTTRHALLLFDVASRIPARATIDAVELRLHVRSAPKVDSVLVTLHAAGAHWGEGASVSGGGQGVPAETGDATWIHRFYPDSLWTSPGGDYQAAPLATARVSDDGFSVWTSGALTDLVQEWLDGSATNFGVLIKGENVKRSVRRFDSREHPEAGLRPELVVTYTR